MDGIKTGLPAAASAIANSGMTQGAIAYFADNVSCSTVLIRAWGVASGRGRGVAAAGRMTQGAIAYLQTMSMPGSSLLQCVCVGGWLC